MSVVTVQIGQCGNQVGCELFSSLSRSPDSVFFEQQRDGGSPFARSVLIDMEPKVIQECLQYDSGGRFRFRRESAFCKQSGSANNWAFGYRKQGPSVHEAILNHVRRELERCDSVSGILVLSSLAGGTGSGVGTYVTDLLRNSNLTTAPLCNSIVWPYQSGEITIQNYNTVLSLGHLYHDSDCIWFHLNDFANDTCVNQLNLPRPNFPDLNHVIASTIASALLPASGLSDPTTTYRPLSDLVDHLCCHPGYKFISSKFYPFVPESSLEFHTDRWSTVLKQTYQRLLSKHEVVSWHIPSREINKSLGASLFVRGEDRKFVVDEETGATDFETSLQPFLQPQLHSSLFAPFYSSSLPSAISVYHSSDRFLVDRSACIVSNSQVIVKPLDLILERCCSMFQSSAYLHHYEKYGIERDDFIVILRRLEQVLVDYRELAMD